MKVLAVCAAAAVVLASCSSDGGDGESARIETSPIAELVGRDVVRPGAAGAADQQLIDEEERRQELIVACMADKGFEYAASDAASVVGAGLADGDAGYGTKEWAETWGYGITTQWFAQATVGETLQGYAEADSGSGDDPNAAIVAALDPDAQQAWYAALYGGDLVIESSENDPDSEDYDDLADLDDEGDPYAGLGCEGEAYTSVATYDAASEFYAEFAEELEAMYAAIDADPRVVEANAAVAECVSGKGVEYRTVEEYRAQVESSFTALQAELYPARTYTEAELAELSPEEVEAAFEQAGALSAESQAQLADLQAAEVELAVAAIDCGAGTGEHQRVLDEVRAEYEQAFLDDNAAAVADYQS